MSSNSIDWSNIWTAGQWNMMRKLLYKPVFPRMFRRRQSGKNCSVIKRCNHISKMPDGKTPIVVPRRKEYGEHVNDHQLIFCREVVKQKKSIILVENVEEISDLIEKYDYKETIHGGEFEHNNEKFVQEFTEIVNRLFAR